MSLNLKEPSWYLKTDNEDDISKLEHYSLGDDGVQYTLCMPVQRALTAQELSKNPVFCKVVTEHQNVGQKSLSTDLLRTFFAAANSCKVTDDVVKKAKASSSAKSLDTYIEEMQNFLTWLQVLKEENTGVDFDIKVGPGGVLDMLVLVLPGRAAEFHSYRDIFGIDATHMKDVFLHLTKEEKDIIPLIIGENERVRLPKRVCVALTGRDADNHNVIIAIAVYYTESSIAINAIFEICAKVGINLNDPKITFIYDR